MAYLSFAEYQYSVVESQGSVEVCLKISELTMPLQDPLSVNIFTSPGTAQGMYSLAWSHLLSDCVKIGSGCWTTFFLSPWPISCGANQRTMWQACPMKWQQLWPPRKRCYNSLAVAMTPCTKVAHAWQTLVFLETRPFTTWVLFRRLGLTRLHYSTL